MCGVFGFLLKRNLTNQDVIDGRTALDKLTHRGPDGWGEWFDCAKGIYLGHRRLAILDPSDKARQPMHFGGLTMVYNGEVYNYLELRDNLPSQQLNSTGDSEVVLRSFCAWGANSFERFDGMFALAIYDGENVHLATDAFGEKPIYWAKSQDGYYFSSEPKPLIDLLQLEPNSTPEIISAFMALGFIPAPNTAYRGLYRLAQGSHLVLHRSGSHTCERYWQPPEPCIGSRSCRSITPQTVDEIEAILTESLRRRLRSDVPLGLFLSGGVDSALVAALATKRLGAELSTYTVSFPDGADESLSAQKIARHLDISHEIIDSREMPGWQDAPDYLMTLYGDLNDNMTAASVFQMSTLVKPKITVALSGLGGDELFYGYNKYYFLYVKRFWYEYGAIFAKALQRLCNHFGFPVPMKKKITFLMGNSTEQFLTLKNSGQRELLRQIPGYQSLIENELPLPDYEVVFRARQFDLEETLPGSYLAAIDRGSMRAGLEVRTPFLNKELLQLLSRVDNRDLLRFGQKHLLKIILNRYLPEDLLTQQKQGFVFPLNRYLNLDTTKPLSNSLPANLRHRLWSERSNSQLSALTFRAQILETLFT